jgi:nucleolar complex protein 2
VAPLLFEILDQTDFNKKNKRLSMRPVDFNCALKLSKSQLQESSFKEVALDHMYEISVDFFTSQAHTIGFPELVLPGIIKLKQFLKSCRHANYTKPIKQLVTKMEENSRFIVDRRKLVTFSIADTPAVENWENSIKTEGTPLSAYHITYRKLRDQELNRMMTANINWDDGVPMMIAPQVKRREMQVMKQVDKQKLPALFGDDDSADDEARFLPPEERMDWKKKQRKEGDASGGMLVQKGKDTSGGMLVQKGKNAKSATSKPEQKDGNKISKDKVKTKNAGKKRKEQEDEDDVEDIVEDLNLSDVEDQDDQDVGSQQDDSDDDDSDAQEDDDSEDDDQDDDDDDDSDDDE